MRNYSRFSGTLLGLVLGLATAVPAAAQTTIERCIMDLDGLLEFTFDVAWANGRQPIGPALGQGPTTSAFVSGQMTWAPGAVITCDPNGEDLAYAVTGSITQRFDPVTAALDVRLGMLVSYVGQDENCTPTHFEIVWRDAGAPNWVSLAPFGEGTRWNNYDEATPNGFFAAVDLQCPPTGSPLPSALRAAGPAVEIEPRYLHEFGL